ncbi:hypothetical protein [Vibrio phage vB_VhaS-a]|nr:hypothetical protein [Vibrio phage vB_VhaS-a]
MANTTLNLIKKAVTAKTEELREAYQSRRANAIAAISEANDGLQPNVDANGRWHAPANGYTISNTPALANFLDCDEDKAYVKGEFLPMPSNPENDFFGFGVFPVSEFKKSFEIHGKLIEFIKERKHEEALKDLPITLGVGKTWNNHNGDLTGYLYLASPFKSVVDAAHEALKGNYKKPNAKPVTGKAPEGLNTVEGVVVKLPSYRNDYYGTIDHKLLLVLDNGCTVYGTLPKSLYDCAVGDRVQLRASFARDEKDDTKGYYKRPAQKQSIILKRGANNGNN